MATSTITCLLICNCRKQDQWLAQKSQQASGTPWASSLLSVLLEMYRIIWPVGCIYLLTYLYLYTSATSFVIIRIDTRTFYYLISSIKECDCVSEKVWISSLSSASPHCGSSATHLTYSLLNGSGNGLGSVSVFLGNHREVGDDGLLDPRQLLQSVQVVLSNLIQLGHYIYSVADVDTTRRKESCRWMHGLKKL